MKKLSVSLVLLLILLLSSVNTASAKANYNDFLHVGSSYFGVLGLEYCGKEYLKLDKKESWLISAFVVFGVGWIKEAFIDDEFSGRDLISNLVGISLACWTIKF